MKCTFHPAVDSQDLCSICGKPLCAECAHKIKNKTYCQTCLVEGAEWIAAVKHLKLPADAPKKAAWLALIPGMGAVYNNEYMKAVTYFAVFAALSIMGSNIHGIFGFGAVVFLIFTMFDAYRTAEASLRRRVQTGLVAPETAWHDRTGFGWGIFLIVLGLIFLLQNLIPFHFLNRLWPLLFILLGAFLVYHALREKGNPVRGLNHSVPASEDSQAKEV